ncbi:MAG: 50S ribosomal protein L28 [Candidatus Hydrogenedentota bacterium]
MSKECKVCGKKSSSGHNVSHSNRKTNRRFNPNLQKLTFVLNEKKTRGYVCTNCIKNNKIIKIL